MDVKPALWLVCAVGSQSSDDDSAVVAFGLNEFSMSASAILRARKMVTEYSVEELQAVADKAMSFATTAEVEDYMRKFVEKITG